MDKIEILLTTTSNQFGFKPGLSTDKCIFLLKEMIHYYKKHGSSVYVSFMDASKAFGCLIILGEIP